MKLTWKGVPSWVRRQPDRSAASWGASRFGRSRPKVALGVAGLLIAGTLSVLAVRDPGYVAQSVDLTRSAVWVTNGAQLLVGRVNRQINELDSAVRVPARGFDVYQDGETVLTSDTSKHELRPIDPVSVTLAGRIKIPATPDVAFGDGVLAIADRASGALWSGRPSELAALDPESTPAAAKTAPGVAVTVSQGGMVFAVAPGSGSLWTITSAADAGQPMSEATAPESTSPAGSTAADPSGATEASASAGPAVEGANVQRTDLDGGALSEQESGKETVAVTAVGETAVVLDRRAGTLRLPGRTVQIPDAESAELQQPGPKADSVLVATSVALLRVSLADGTVDEIIKGRSGAPAAPVQLDGCVHAAWSSSPAFYGLACNGAGASVREVPGHTGDQAMVFRVNGHTIVLNDVATGSVWAADDDIRLINNWDDVQPLSDDSDDQQDHSGAEGLSTQLATPRLDCAAGKQVNPPSPQDDVFGVRAGRPTVLKVLDNDASDNCSMTVITGVSGWDDNATGLQVVPVDGGQALQVTVPDSGSGMLPLLTYQVSDGLGHQADGRVSITAYRGDEHKPAARVRGSSVPVETLGTVSYNVLDDYVSPTGDDLYLLSASIDGGDEVTFQPNGLITFADKGVGGAVRKTVDFQIGDDGGDEPVAGKLTVDVRPEGTAEPITSPVYARAVAGRPATIDILSSVIAPSIGAAQLSAVTPLDKTSVSVGAIHQGAGTVTITGSKPGSYYFVYQAKSGEKSAEGLLRVDVVDPSANPHPPIGVTDVVYLPDGGVATVDPMVNDVDPSGSGLAVIQVEPDSTLSATLESLQMVTISARSSRALQEAHGGSITYTVSNGYAAAPGLIRVVPVPAADPLPPVARDVDATVRAGDAVTIPIAGYAYDPSGDVISLTGLDTGTVPAGSGVLFHTESAIRYLAPVPGPAKTLHFGYTVTNSAGLSATGSVALQVVNTETAQNHPPGSPEPVVARVFTGSAVSIPLLLSGIDPDGDWVTLRQVGEHAGDPLGRAVVSGLSSIDYQAGKQAGPDTFSYVAADPAGEAVTGQVTVLVVDPPSTVQPPTAPDLHVTARPGKTVAVEVVQQIAAVNTAQQLALGDPAFEAPPNWTVIEDRAKGRLVIATPEAETVGTFKYTVVNQAGLSASGVITLTVSKSDPLKPPTAKDIVVDPATIKPGDATVQVPIPDDKLTNPSGTVDDLVLSLDPQSVKAGSASGRTVSITLTDRRQVLAYRVTNIEKASATAFIVVPAAAANPLTVEQVGPLSVKAGEVLSVDVAASLKASDGAALQIPNGSKVSVTGGGDIGRVDGTHLRYTSPKEGNSTVLVSLTVEDAKGRTAQVQLSVEVIPTDVPAPVVKDAQLDVEVGKTATLDLANLVTAGNADQQKLLKYQITGTGDGLQTSVTGSVLTVTAALTAKGARATFTLTAADGQGKTGTGTVAVKAIASTQPLLRVSDTTVNDGRPGKASTVNVQSQVTYNPFPTPPTLVSQSVRSGAGSVSAVGGTLQITPSKVGTVVVEFTLRDATADHDRDVSGTVTVIVKDKPDKPGTPTVVSMVSHTVQIKWTLPKDNGSPITTYHVSDGETGFSQPCATSPCTLTGLTNGTAYSFSVVAVNDIGNSESSEASAPVTPDTAPNTPAPPVLTWLKGQQSLQLDWKDPGSEGTPISAYDIEISTPDAKGTTTVPVGNVLSYTWNDLGFGKAYTFRLRAHNASKDASGWSPMSLPETPSTIASAPQNVSVSYGVDAFNSGGHTLTVTWKPPTDSGGAPIEGFHVIYTPKIDGKGDFNAKASETAATIQGAKDGTTYTVQVAAINRSLDGTVGSAPPVKPYSLPETVTGVTATTRGDSGVVLLAWKSAAGHGRDIYRYLISYGGTSTTSTETSIPIEHLTNGQSYTFNVSACYGSDGESRCGAAGKNQPSVIPYGPISDPAITNASASGQQITFDWSWPAANGRPVTTTATVDGASASGSHWSGTVGYNASRTLTLKACPSEGDCTKVSRTIVTGPPPPPVVSVYKGGTASVGGCSSGCNHIDISLANFPAGATVKLYFNSPQGNFYTNATVNSYQTFSVDGNGNRGRTGTWYVYGINNPSQVTVTAVDYGVSGSSDWS